MPPDRLSRLREHFACGGSRDLVERQVCFHQIVRLFNEWPTGPDRDEAFAEAKRELHRWSHIFREVYALAGESLVYDEASRSVRDTLALVRGLHVRRHDDDHFAPPLSAILRSPHARELSMLHVSGMPVTLEELARGPGAAQLGALVLDGGVTNDASDTSNASDASDESWAALECWPGLATLQFLQLGGASAQSCSSEQLWALLERAPVFASLHAQPLDFDRFMDRVDAHPAVAHLAISPPVEQLFPVESVGAKYVITRSPIRSSGAYHEPDVIRFVGAAEDAAITTSPPVPGVAVIHGEETAGTYVATVEPEGGDVLKNEVWRR